MKIKKESKIIELPGLMLLVLRLSDDYVLYELYTQPTWLV